MRRPKHKALLIVVMCLLAAIWISFQFRGVILVTDELPIIEYDYVFSPSTCQQNISVANITGFHSFPAHLKNFLYYRHCRHFPLLLDSPGKCQRAESGNVFLLLIIKTSPGNSERREALRKTWAEERQINGRWVRRIFISGTTGYGLEKIKMNRLLKGEQQVHNDIIQWDFEDTHCNLTLKQVLFMEWLDKNCPKVQFLFNGDDDVFAHTENIVEYLQSLADNDGSTHLFSGFVRLNDPPVRKILDKYFVPTEIYKLDLYPPYCSGGGILLSRFTASVMYNITQSIPLFPMDDVYLGMILAEAGLDLTTHAGVKTFGLELPSKKLDKLDPCFYKDLLLVHRFLPKELYILWQRLYDPKRKCFQESNTFLQKQTKNHNVLFAFL